MVTVGVTKGLAYDWHNMARRCCKKTKADGKWQLTNKVRCTVSVYINVPSTKASIYA